MKHTQQNILKILKDKRERLTPVREALVKLFVKNQEQPLSAPEICEQLRKSGLRSNKTTIYRQLEDLLQLGILETVNFEDGKIRYELSGDHHHHLVCIYCLEVQDAAAGEELQKFESAIGRRYHFKVRRHSLEFYGICRKCQNKKG